MLRPPRAKETLASRKRGESGSAVVEFALASLVWMPLLLGTTLFGYNLIRAVQVSQICRDAGHMYAYGVDFTQSQNQALLVKLLAPLNIQQNAGAGALVLSKITYVTAADCTAAAASNPPIDCANNGQYVFTTFLVFGNPSIAKTKLGEPGSYLQTTTFSLSNYLNKSELRATEMSKYLTFTSTTQSGQIAYASELTLQSQFMSFDTFTSTGSYARTFF